jgi:hypothetical protein
MTTLNIGDCGLVTQHDKTKRIRVTGFWKFKPFSPCKDEFTSKILSKLIEKDIAEGVIQRTERIEPCSQEEAQIISTNSGFFNAIHVKLDTTVEPLDANAYQEEHDHILALMKKDGEMGLYGRIKLPVDQYPNLFDSKGKLLPQESVEHRNSEHTSEMLNEEPTRPNPPTASHSNENKTLIPDSSNSKTEEYAIAKLIKVFKEPTKY